MVTRQTMVVNLAAKKMPRKVGTIAPPHVMAIAYEHRHLMGKRIAEQAVARVSWNQEVTRG